MSPGSVVIRRKVKRAMDYVLEGIASERFPKGSSLPSIRQLAPLAGVSSVTMWKAVKYLRSQGILTAVAGQATRVSSGVADIPQSAPSPQDESPAVSTPRRSVHKVRAE